MSIKKNPKPKSYNLKDFPYSLSTLIFFIYIEAFTHHCSWWNSSQTPLSAQLLPFSQKCRSVLLSPRDFHPPGTRLQVKNTSLYSVLCHLGSSFWNITSPFHCWVRWRVKEGEGLYRSFQAHSLVPIHFSWCSPGPSCLSELQVPIARWCWASQTLSAHISAAIVQFMGKSHALKAHTVFAKEVTSDWQPRDILSVLCRAF